MAKLHRIFWLTAAIVFLSPGLLYPQSSSLVFDHLSAEDGLSQNNVLCLFQDSKGLMWFGTLGGLNRFDGYSFKVYRHDPNDPRSLSHNSVNSIYEDHEGVLWIATRDGLNKFDRETETFTRYKSEPENPESLSSNYVTSIFEDRFGVLWFGTWDGGLNKFVKTSPVKNIREGSQKATVTFVHYVHDPSDSNSLSNNNVSSIYEDHLGTFWIATFGGGLNKFDRDTQKFTHYTYKHVNSNYMTTLLEDRSGTLWVGTVRDLKQYNREKDAFVSHRPYPQSTGKVNSNRVLSLFEDQHGVLWAATFGGGLHKVIHQKSKDSKEKAVSFVHYTHDPDNPSSLSNDAVWSVYEDRSGVLWVGTQDGLNKFDPAKQKFKHYTTAPHDKNSLSNKLVTYLYEDRTGILWIGTHGGGLNKLNRKTGTFTHYIHNPNDPGSLSYDEIWCIHEDRQGFLWVGTRRGLNRFDRETGTYTHYQIGRKNSKGLSSSNIITIYEDRSGVLWIGTARGLNKYDRTADTFKRYIIVPEKGLVWGDNAVWAICEDHLGELWIRQQPTNTAGFSRFDRETETFTRFTHDPSNPESLSHNEVYTIFEDRQGVLWIGTANGLNRFDREKESFIRYMNDPQDPKSLSSNSVNSILEDSLGALWIGTDAGLNRFDRATESFTHYKEEDKLGGETRYEIFEHTGGDLWIYTNSGLAKFNIKSERFKNYDVSDGLQSNEFYNSAYCKSAITGEMFLGGNNGFNIFHPDSLRDNPYIPPVVITRFERYNTDRSEGTPIIEKGISTKEHIQLSHKDNILTFEFAALNYRNTLKNQYAYKLEGFTENWIQLGTQRRVTFTNLNPGEYTLRVKASNNDGIWNEEGTSLKITILPPWWKTWWAYSIYVALILGTLYAIRRYELSRQHLKHNLEVERLEMEKVHEFDRLKSRFFANVSHEFRTPLTLISGPVQQLLSGQFKGNVKEQYHLILRNTRRLLRLVNQLLDLSRLESGKMRLQARPENIVELTRQLTMAFESLASVKHIELHFVAPAQPVTVYVDREHYEKIINNLLSNAFKFTPAGGVIEVAVADGSRTYSPASGIADFIEITIKDTGRGIPADHLPHIFDRFYQADDTYVKDTPGSGIGLALTKELIELHHGTIEVASEVGKGTEFTIRLPLGKEHLKPEEMVESPPAPLAKERIDQSLFEPEFREIVQTERKQPTRDRATIVLIVEDNPDMRGYIRDLLVETYRVVEAADGAAGFEQATEIIPDIIISDVMMPEMDGFQFCEKIKTDERTSHVPVILLTAKSSGESKVEGLETGADDYLIKPFDSSELRVRVKNLIEQRRKLRERFKSEITLEPQQIAITSADAKFLQRVMDAVEERIEEPAFGVTELSHEAGMSRSQLHRKLRALTDQSPVEFIRIIKLKRAAALLEHHAGNISEVAYQVGFNNPAYFSECFRKLYGVSPKEYISQFKN